MGNDSNIEAENTNYEPRFLYLFIALVILLISIPILLASEHFRIFSVLHWGVMIAAILACNVSRRALKVAILFASIAFLFSTANFLELHESVFLGVISKSATGLFYVYAIYHIGRVVFDFEAKSVTGHTIYGAVSIYLLIGMLWALIYGIFNDLDPAAFSNTISTNGLGMADFVYFSFVTMTTLGYGDITPTSPALRSITVFEAIIGQLYIAIMIGRLASIFVPIGKKSN